MSEIKLPEDLNKIAIMASEPLKGCTPDQMREMASKYDSDEALAAIYASVSNKTGWIGHDIGKPENDEETNNLLKKELNEWWRLEKRTVCENCFSVTERERRERNHTYNKRKRYVVHC